mmetsp:Transcript_7420/g.11610  ORF Transcript_7420/g.11610 Transcript_7420/m.11610 type:complete len:165 (-) Transcript_7420:33-527(-)
MVFDAPLINKTFRKRKAILEDRIAKLDCPFVKTLKQTVCKSQEHLDQEMEKVLAKDGEGLMIKDPSSKYERRRSDKLLKIKKFDDSEAKVTGWEYGSGKNEEVMGAILVTDVKTGTKFKIGSGFTDKQRANPPKTGTIISYKHQGSSNTGVPRFPIFMREHPGM